MSRGVSAFSDATLIGDHSIEVLRPNDHTLPASTRIDTAGDADDVIGTSRHTDHGFITVLWADQEPGLLINLGELTTRADARALGVHVARVKAPVTLDERMVEVAASDVYAGLRGRRPALSAARSRHRAASAGPSAISCHDRVVDFEAVLRNVPYLAGASPAALRRLTQRAELRSFARREFLFHEGDPVERVFLVVEGQVAATMTSAEGATVTAHVAGPGEVCGRVDLFAGSTFTVSAQAVSSGSALAVPARTLRSVLESEPECLRLFTTDLAIIVTSLTQAVTDLVFLDVTGRLARLLLDGADAEGAVAMPGTQSELAARLGVTRQTLNSALSRLVRAGVVEVESRARVRITDAARLAGLAGVSPR